MRELSKDRAAAVLLIAMGFGIVAFGLSYKIGSLNRMGAGFVPVVLGVLMMLTGVAIGVTAAPAGREAMTNPLPGDGQHGGVEWRGWLCILSGVLAFVLLGQYGGLLPATFASVFISAMGDRNNTIRGAATLGAILTAFCVGVFHYGLHLQLPLFQWG